MNPPVFTKLDDFKKDISYIGRSILLFILIEIVFNLVLFALIKYAHLPLNDTSYQGILVCIGSIVSIIPCILYAKNRLRIQWKPEEFQFNFSFVHVINVVCSMYAIAYAVTILLTMIRQVLHINFLSSELFQSNNPMDIFFTCFGAIVIAPILEELFCRGILCRALARYSRFVAIVLTGLFFGMMHMNFQQGAMHILTGAMLAYVSLEYRSIALTIVCHMIYNGLAAAISYTASVPVLGVIAGILVIAMGVYGVIVICKEAHRIYMDTSYPYLRIAFHQVSIVLSIIAFVIFSLLEIAIS